MRSIAGVLALAGALTAITAGPAAAREGAAGPATRDAAAPRAAAAAPAHRADGDLADWAGEPTYLAGRTQVSRGELIYTDYLYDDYGPDLNHLPDAPAFRANLAPTNGDYRYPSDADRYGHNAADLRELRIAADGDGLHVLIGLQTMKAPDAAIATIAIDTDGNPATGLPPWPDGIGLHTPGVDRFITTWGTGAHVTKPLGQATPVPTAANLDENAVEVDVPYGALGDIGPNAKVYAVTGLNDGGRYMAQPQGGPGVFNVAFRGDDDWPRLTGHWGEHLQSQALAGGDISRFAQPLHLSDLRDDRTIPFQLTPGFYDRIFRSRYDYGEGIDLKQGSVQGTATPMFRSRWQPYGLYIPKGYDPQHPAPLLLDGHSLDVNHNEYRAVSPNQLRQLGDDRGSIIITPLARGIDTWYLDAGFGDVMEAWRDVRAHYAVDTARTSITGYSMGGYMTYRLGLLMPDRFARASVYVGPPAYYQWPYPLPVQSTPEWLVPGNTNLIVGNALNLPYEVVQGNADELVPVSGVQKQVDDLMAAGVDTTFYRHGADDHLSFILADEWARTRDFLGTPRIDRNPVRVRYRRYPSMDLPRFGLRFDRAYWVSRLDVRAAGAWGEIDATTLGRGGHERVPGPKTTKPGVNIGGLTPAVVTERHQVDGDALPRADAFRATLRNIASVRLATARMGLRPQRRLTAALRGDGTTRLTFAGRFPATTRARLDGRRVRVTRVKGGIRLVLRLASGPEHRLVVAPARR